MKTRRFSGHHVHYIHEGNGLPIILVHGAGGSHLRWKSLIPDLVRAEFQIYALDLLGHGQSEKPDCNGAGYDIEAIYAHFANWVSSLELKHPPILIGHSMGAYLMLLYALRNPGRVRGMILISPFYSPDQLSLITHLSLRRLRLSKAVLSLVPRWTIASAIALTNLNGEHLSLETCNQMASDFKRIDPQVITFPLSTQDLSPLLSRVRTRSIVVWGEKDLTLSPDSYPKLVHALPNSKACPLPGGHNIHLSSVAFNQRLLEFLNDIFGLVPGEIPNEK